MCWRITKCELSKKKAQYCNNEVLKMCKLWISVVNSYRIQLNKIQPENEVSVNQAAFF